MRKVDDGEKKRKKKRKEREKKEKRKEWRFSGHYVIASSLPPELLRPNDDRWNAARSCQKAELSCATLGLSLQIICSSNGLQSYERWAGYWIGIFKKLF